MQQLAAKLAATEDGEVRIRYYSAVNRLSAVALRLLDGEHPLPAELRMGCVFDVLTAINRYDLLFTSVLTLLHADPDAPREPKRGNGETQSGETQDEGEESASKRGNGETQNGEVQNGEATSGEPRNGEPRKGEPRGSRGEELTTGLFFAALQDYLACGRLSQIPPSSLDAFLGFLESTQSAATCFALERRFVRLQFAAEADAVLPIFFARGFLLAGAALSINSRADFVRPLDAVFQALHAPPRALWTQYPAVLPAVLPGDAPTAGLESLFLFLLHLALLGLTLGNAPLNSLGRITSQSDCLAWLVRPSPRGTPLDALLARHPAFVLGLLFYALSVKPALPA